MSFQTELADFSSSHPMQQLQIDGLCFHYLLCGNPDSPFTLVYLIGGSGNPLGWYGHVLAMEGKYRILLLDYPMGEDRMEPLTRLIGKLLDALEISSAVWIGASLGGYVAQIMAASFPERTRALVLYATTALTEQGIQALKQQYRYVGPLLRIMEHLPYGPLKALMLKPSLNRLIPRDDPQAEYLSQFVQWVYDGYTRESDLHLTRLMADLANVTPLTRASFQYLRNRILLILPREDKAFTREMQDDLIQFLPEPQVRYSQGGHLDTLCRAARFAVITDDFLSSL